jgi:putative glutamine amidotransferase
MVSDALPHRVETPADAIAHDIAVSPASRLAGVLAWNGRGALPVNSRHHQACARLAPGFQVSATAADGVIEAIERPDGFCIGVQWHPENFWRTGEFQRLFDGLSREARAHGRR